MEVKDDSIIEPQEELNVIKTGVFDEFQAEMEECQFSLLKSNRSDINEINNININIKINDTENENIEVNKNLKKSKKKNTKLSESSKYNVKNLKKSTISQISKPNNINTNIYKKDANIKKKKGHKRIFSINLQIEKEKSYKSQVTSPKFNKASKNIPSKNLKIKKNFDKNKKKVNKITITKKPINDIDCETIKNKYKIVSDLIENYNEINNSKLIEINELLNKILINLKK